METESCKKVAPYFCCECCDYATSRKSSFDKHKMTLKHSNATKLTEVNKKVAESCKKVATCQTFSCEKCCKPYTSRTGLWKHLKNCNEKQSDFDFTDKELIMTLLKENNELKTMMIEQQNAVIELCKNGTNNTVHNNSHNKTFNLQFFLNETCKDAMNLMDFVHSIQLQLSDLEKVGEIGYVDGISNIIVKNLKDLNITQRPIHCTDKKREILYIKDENKWEKEDDENNKIRKAIKHVAYKNTKLLTQFREKHPDCGKSESLYSDQYNKLIIEAMGGKGLNDTEKDKKIIKNITKEVVIDK